jgi:cytokinin dehydrogenase
MERKISRREFTKRLATGAALLGLPSSCTSPSSLPTGQLLRNDLTDLSGTLVFGDSARQAAADDFGHIVHRLPTAVLKPGSIQDIVKLFNSRTGMASKFRCEVKAMRCLAKLRLKGESSSTPVR